MSKICIISTIRAPLNETIIFVNYHLNIGVDELIIFFDDPQDAAISFCNKYSQVTCIRCDESHWQKHGNQKLPSLEERQVINVNIGTEIAKIEGCQWIIHIDSDELIYPYGNLQKILSKCEADVLIFTINEAVPEEDYYDNIFSAALFKKISRSIKVKLAMLLGCRRSFFEGAYFKGHVDSKAAVRISSKIKQMGIHRPKFISNDLVVVKKTRQIKLLHYDCVGVDAWKSKWISRIDGSVTCMGDNRQRQLDVFAEAYSDNEEAMLKLYKRLYFVPKYEQIILRLLNMLTTIQISRDLFDSPRKITNND